MGGEHPVYLRRVDFRLIIPEILEIGSLAVQESPEIPGVILQR